MRSPANPLGPTPRYGMRTSASPFCLLARSVTVELRNQASIKNRATLIRSAICCRSTAEEAGGRGGDLQNSPEQKDIVVLRISVLETPTSPRVKLRSLRCIVGYLHIQGTVHFQPVRYKSKFRGPRKILTNSLASGRTTSSALAGAGSRWKRSITDYDLHADCHRGQPRRLILDMVQGSLQLDKHFSSHPCVSPSWDEKQPSRMNAGTHKRHLPTSCQGIPTA